MSQHKSQVLLPKPSEKCIDAWVLYKNDHSDENAKAFLLLLPVGCPKPGNTRAWAQYEELLDSKVNDRLANVTMDDIREYFKHARRTTATTQA
jgi:hypothetical protein